MCVEFLEWGVVVTPRCSAVPSLWTSYVGALRPSLRLSLRPHLHRFPAVVAPAFAIALRRFAGRCYGFAPALSVSVCRSLLQIADVLEYYRLHHDRVDLLSPWRAGSVGKVRCRLWLGGGVSIAVLGGVSTHGAPCVCVTKGHCGGGGAAPGTTSCPSLCVLFVLSLAWLTCRVACRSRAEATTFVAGFCCVCPAVGQATSSRGKRDGSVATAAE